MDRRAIDQLRGLGQRASGSVSSCQVAVELRPQSSREREMALKRIGALGLEIESQIGSTFLGTIPARALGALRGDDAILQVEVSTPLSVHTPVR